MTDPRPLSRRARLRHDIERKIMQCAEEAFAVHGFEGASLTDIAERSALSKQNLLYYFPTKLALYKRVLDDVMDEWLRSMEALAHTRLAPTEALDIYVDAKIDFSIRRPHGSRMYAREMIGGARHYRREIKSRLVPMLQKNIARLEEWMDQGLAERVSAEHLFFAIWATTQAYADVAAQMQLVLGRRALSAQDFSLAKTTLKAVVRRTLNLEGGKNP